MPEEKKRSAEALALLYLRLGRGWSKKDLAAVLELADEKSLTRYENGGRDLSREQLGTLIAPLEVLPEAPDFLIWVHPLIFPEAEGTSAGDPLALTPEERGRIDRAVLGAGWALAEGLPRALAREKRDRKVAAARREAETLAERLKSASARDRRHLIEIFPEYRSWALAEALAHASVGAAAHEVTEARELAELALSVARRVPGAAQRARTEGYCTGFLANVRRVATEFAEAGEAFAQTWALWREGEPAAQLPLAEWRLLDLEASLRRAQHRFPEALERLDRALALCGGQPVAAGRILLKKEQALYQMGDVEGALAALAQAAPWVEAAGDLHQLFALRFKTVKHLCAQERFMEAEALLPAVREMAIEQGRKLDLLRVQWLSSKVDAGKGRTAKAIAGLEQVRREFAEKNLPYEAALSSLDLALLWLGAGRTAEVRELAAAMSWIFQAKGIAREASAALALFCEAAREELATIGMARRLIAKVEKVQRGAAPAKE
jgi:transcriptional regulator with XRE-family HTH domain